MRCLARQSDRHGAWDRREKSRWNGVWIRHFGRCNFSFDMQLRKGCLVLGLFDSANSAFAFCVGFLLFMEGWSGGLTGAGWFKAGDVSEGSFVTVSVSCVVCVSCVLLTVEALIDLGLDLSLALRWLWPPALDRLNWWWWAQACRGLVRIDVDLMVSHHNLKDGEVAESIGLREMGWVGSDRFGIRIVFVGGLRRWSLI